MSELISRRAAVSRISDLLLIELKGRRLPTWNEVYRAINDLPSAQPETRWIPVTERLPEEYSRCLVTVTMFGGFRYVRLCTYGRPEYSFTETNEACFYETDSEWGDCEISGVIAWMSLPEPYEGGGE